MLVLAARKCATAYLASRLDEVAESHGQIVSGIDLGTRELQFAQFSDPRLTAGLATLAVRRAAVLARDVPHWRAIPARPIRRSLLAALLVFGVGGLLVFFLPRIAWTQWQRFSDPYGDHPPFSRVQIAVAPKGATVVFGSGVDIRATLDGPPVQGLELVLRGKTISMRKEILSAEILQASVKKSCRCSRNRRGNGGPA